MALSLSLGGDPSVWARFLLRHGGFNDKCAKVENRINCAIKSLVTCDAGLAASDEIVLDGVAPDKEHSTNPERCRICVFAAAAIMRVDRLILFKLDLKHEISRRTL